MNLLFQIKLGRKTVWHIFSFLSSDHILFILTLFTKTMKHGRLKTLNYFAFWNSFALDAARPRSIWKLNWVHRIAHFFIVWSWQIIKGFELFQECVLRRQVVDSSVHRTLFNTDHCIIVNRHRCYNQVRKKYENVEYKHLYQYWVDLILGWLNGPPLRLIAYWRCYHLARPNSQSKSAS